MIAVSRIITLIYFENFSLLYILSNKFIWDRREQDRRLSSRHNVSFGRFSGLSLQLNANVRLLGLLPESLVLLDALEEVVSALGVAHVLDAYVDPLSDDASANPLVHDHS